MEEIAPGLSHRKAIADRIARRGCQDEGRQRQKEEEGRHGRKKEEVKETCDNNRIMHDGPD
jgi:hypothetical protein